MSRTRQAGIINILLQKEIVRVSDLSTLYQVSPLTIRRDLNQLEKIGMVTRFYGGAILDEVYSNRLNANYVSNLAEQRELIEEAIAHIAPKSTIAITPSKIHETLCHMLPEDFDLTIVTNSLNIFDIAKDKFSKVVLTGGYYMKSTKSFEGEETKTAIEQQNIDYAFIGFNGMSNGVIYTGTMMESIVKNSLIKNSKETIVLVEDYKNDYKSNFKLCLDSTITHVIRSSN